MENMTAHSSDLVTSGALNPVLRLLVAAKILVIVTALLLVMLLSSPWGGGAGVADPPREPHELHT